MGRERFEEAIVLKPDDSSQGELANPATARSPTPGGRDQAEKIVSGFYRGLGISAGTATRSARRHELADARELADAGATPTEAETFAAEKIVDSQRRATVTLRSYKFERSSWLAEQQQRTDRGRPVVRVANGRMPE